MSKIPGHSSHQNITEDTLINTASNITKTIREPLLILDSDLNYVNSNPAFLDVFSLNSTAEFIENWNSKSRDFVALRKAISNNLPTKALEDLPLKLSDSGDSSGNYLVNANYLELEKAQSGLILISFKRGIDSRTQEEKNEHVERFDDIFSQAPAMICLLTGPEHVFEMANDNYYRLIGHRDIIGKTVRQALPDIEGQGFYEMLDNVYQSGEASRGNEMLVTLQDPEQGSKQAYIDFVYQPIKNSQGSVTGIFVHALDVTEKVESRHKLEKSEQELQDLVDAVPAILWISKADGENYYLNKKWFEYTGQTLNDIKNLGWLDAVHPEDRSEVEQSFKTANAEKKEFQANFRLRNKNGDYRWVRDSGSLKFSSEGEYEGMVGTVIDIHEEKLKEQLVNEKEHRIRSIIEEATVATALYTGEEMRISMANDAMIQLWGKDHSVIGTTLHEALPELEGQPFHDLLQQVYSTGKMYWGKEDPASLMIDGKLQTNYFNYTYKALRNESGEIYGILNMAVDVTEMKKSKEKIKESEARFRLMADMMPEKIASTDAAGNFTYFNQGWLEYTGLSSDDLISKGWFDFIHPSDKEEFAEKWNTSHRTGEDFEMEFRFLNNKKKYNWHLSRAEAIADEKGQIQMWIFTATEIQKLKAEEKRKEDFLKMVSHELKTPVTSIKGYVQLLLSLLKRNEGVDNLGIPLQTSLERIDHQIVRLTRLISEMLDLSRIEKNKLELQKERFRLNNLVKETVQDIRYTNTQYKISIQEEVDFEVYGDKDRIGQVLINLVTNAIKYSPNSQEVDIRVYKSGEDQVSVSVKDHGIGISKKNQKKIFKRFYRVDGKNEETYSGFGIGLYLAKEIIKRHNGSIAVKSEKGEGSEFTFTLKIASENN
ncbi:PAS domain S-box protein [Gramella sp. GC03-9]|uniref:histidine kinase n=1 Tax=Christiangramia oceanisediminis TaxID=2920386 RepID=A0A9X2KXB5_9FLAO|nr:PAS domain-containing sensor histidine kinase [Gramella oceanisediminis]MCP9199006.1 PAS domain S-box protein [Gramella oceanisediminis]